MPLLERGPRTHRVITFPNDPLFKQLLNHAKESDEIIIYDPDRGVEATHAQLLCDISTLRQAIYEHLPESIRGEDMAIGGERPYICILAPCSYEFIVAFFTILALGGAPVPVSPNILHEEGCYFVDMCKSACILSAPEHLDLAITIQQRSNGIAVVPLNMEKPATSSNAEFQIDEKLVLSPDSPGALFFTSGSTGTPKGVVHKRNIFYLTPSERRYDERFLSYRPVDWMGGCSAIFDCILRGVPLEIFRTDGSAAPFWERLRRGGITKISGPPRMWLHLMEYYQEKLAGLPPEILGEYNRGVRGIHAAQLNSALSSPSTIRFWERMLGKPLGIVYTGTEMGGKGIGRTLDTDSSLERCIGKPESDVTVKLSEGSHGEILIKTTSLFSHYLNDEAATRAAFDDEGFYRTGDEAHLVGDDYFLDGRVATDIIRFYGFKVLVLELESSMMELDYVSEAYALPIQDIETGYRVGVLLRLQTHPQSNNSQEGQQDGLTLALAKLRTDLSATLSTYKLPTLLRILRDGDEAPQTVSSKIAKQKAIQKYFFSRSADSPANELPADVQVWDIKGMAESKGKKAWDWSGLTSSEI